MSDTAHRLQTVIAYHQRTKHHPHRHAASLGYLDWASQPDPFRRYAGAPLIPLPLPATDPAPRYADLFAAPGLTPAPLGLQTLSRFLRLSLSLTARKRHGGSEWFLRANPSSGNLHPTEGYLVLGAIAGIGDEPAVYHYAPREHGLERRAVLDRAAHAELLHPDPADFFLVGLTSIHWREAWKYGERAWRYCQHDVGHALAALRVAAAGLGWQLRLLEATADPAIATLLGLDRDTERGPAEREEPDLLAVVATHAPNTVVPAPGAPSLDLARRVATAAAWCGQPNVLSSHHLADWPVIDEVAAAVRRLDSTPTAGLHPSDSVPPAPPARSPATDAGPSLDRVVLARRSAVAMDGETSLDAVVFYRMLARLLPACADGSIPWDAVGWRPRVHLGLFVHRVDGLAPGLYLLARHPAAESTLRAASTLELDWTRPPGCPPGLPLVRLSPGDCRDLAAALACNQEIASDGVFAAAMLAEFDATLTRFGASAYRQLFWEAGLIGQMLYLEAEAVGVRGTGIGCFFDDPVHRVFGLEGTAIQSLYHFTVGGPVDDPRLTTLEPYAGRG